MILHLYSMICGLPWWLRQLSICLQWGRPGFDPWVRKIPLRRKWQPTPVLWPPHEKSWCIGKDSDAGRDWGQEEKGKTEDEMAGWHHWLDGRESEWTLGVGDGQGGLACCDSLGRKESDTTERLIWSDHSLRLLCSYTLWRADWMLLLSPQT